MAYTYGSVTNCKVRNGQTRNEYECRLGYEVQSQSIENNTSTVKLRLECRSISSSYTTKGSSGLTSIIDGTTVKSNASVDMSNTNTWQNFGERTITITHNADGTCSVSKSGSFTCTAGSSNYSLSSGSASVTVQPATIPRASQPTVSTSSVNFGDKITIYTNRVSNSFGHYLYYSINGSAEVDVAPEVSYIYDNYTWTVPLSLMNNIPNATSTTITLRLVTYNGSTIVGSKTISFTATVSSNIIPSISSIALSAGNSVVPSSWGVYVQGKSTLKVVTSASGSYGSSITSYKITGIDNNTYYSSNFTSSTLQTAGTRTIKVTVTDSRGRTATKTTQYTCVTYSNPSISVATVTRCNEDGTANEEGEYVKYSFKASISSINNKNTYSYKLGYKNSTSSSYTYITISNSAYTLDKGNVIISGVTFSVDNSYDFEFLVTDYFTSTSVTKTIGTGFTLMDFRYTGKGMAIGKVSEEDILEVALPAQLTGGVRGDIIMNTGHEAKIYWKEYGYGDQFAIVPRFNDADDANKLKIMGAVGNAETTPELYDLLTVSGKSGNVWAKGDLSINNVHFRNIARNTTDTWIPVMNNGNIDYTLRQFHSGTLHTDHPNNQDYLATIDFLSYWNGAYNSNGSSNLLRCKEGAIQAKPVVAYSNGSGTSGTVTLSHDASTFSHIRITYKNDDNQYGSTTVSDVNTNSNGTHYGAIARKNSADSAIMINSALFNVSGTTITIARNSQANIYFDGTDDKSDGNKLYITKVELWN